MPRFPVRAIFFLTRLVDSGSIEDERAGRRLAESVGYSYDGNFRQDLLARAGQGLLEVRTLGRNRICYLAAAPAATDFLARYPAIVADARRVIAELQEGAGAQQFQENPTKVQPDNNGAVKPKDSFPKKPDPPRNSNAGRVLFSLRSSGAGTTARLLAATTHLSEADVDRALKKLEKDKLAYVWYEGRSQAGGILKEWAPVRSVS